MSHPGRACTIARLTEEARSCLQELRAEQNRQTIGRLLDEAAADPIASYRKRLYPRFVVWELTLACNMRCEHCGSAAGKPRPDELSLDEMLGVCDALGELGCERVTLLGGEPLIHPHWPEVARRIRQNGFRANVITNGWTLHRPELCDAIAAAELSIVGISLDGLAPHHDALRRRPGSFERIMRGIALLQQRRVPVAITTVITAQTIDDLPALHDLLEQKGVRVWQLQIANPLGRLERGDPLLLSPERLPELLDFVVAKKRAAGPLRIDIADNVGYFGAPEEAGIRQKPSGKGSVWTGCHAGIQAMGLDANGDVKGCQSLPSTPPFIEGNVRQRPLAEIWNDPEAFAYTRRFSPELLQGECARCPYGALCKAGCTSAALAHSGSVGDNPMCLQRAGRHP